MKIFKITTLIIILIISTISLTGCFNSHGIENRAYVIAVGIDKGDTAKLKISFQIPTLSSPNSSNMSSDSSSQASQATLISVECSTFDEGLSLINSYISKKVNLSHCKALIISEDLAKEGISEYIFTLANNLELRPNCHVLISKCNAYDFLNDFTPSLEAIAARYYELILNSAAYSGYTEDNYLYDFYENILSTTTEAFAILVDINQNANANEPKNNNIINTATNSETSNENNSETNNKSNNTENLENISNPEGTYVAGDTPIKSQSKNEAMGTAVFKKDKYVGELNNLETLSHLIITSKLNNANVNIPSPFDENKNISLSITLRKKTHNRLDIINGTPFITCNIEVLANVNTMDYEIDLTKKENLEQIQNVLNEYLKENIYNYLNKTSKELNSDIAGFGKLAIPKYLTWKDWEDSNWLENYKNTFFNVNVNSIVAGSYLYTRI